jgi:hypothetical protein
MDSRPTAKAVTERAAGVGRSKSSATFAGRRRLGPRRPTSSARPFDGTSGGGGDTRDLTGMSWLGSGGGRGSRKTACDM